MSPVVKLRHLILIMICMLSLSTYFLIKKFDDQQCLETYAACTNISDNIYNEILPNTSKFSCEVIHIISICAGPKSSQQVVTLFKSLLFHRKNPIHAHFVVDSSSKLVLSYLFQTWNVPDLTISFYLADPFVDDVSWIPNSHYSGIYGLLKVVVLKILPSYVKKIILLDTDLIIHADIAQLWYYFKFFKIHEAMGLVENQSDWYLGTLWMNYSPWPALGRGFNTGVMLLDCEKLKMWGWEKNWKDITKLTIKTVGNLTLADQDIVNNLLKNYPFLVHTLPCEWNVQLSDNVRIDLCLTNHLHKIHILHWNNYKKKAKYQAIVEYLQPMYQLYEELNGDLLRLPLLYCRIDLKENLVDLNSGDRFCKTITESSLLPRRTHLFYLPFEYNQSGKNDVSVVVQLSFNRLSALEKLCSSWNGVVSAAIFLSDMESSLFVNYISNSNILHNRQNIAYHLVYRNSNDNVYPINLLRNIALNNAVTEFVFLCDVDFALMPSLYEYITSFITTTYINDKDALIVPAFACLHYAFEIPLTKSQLLAALENGYVSTFRKYVWEKGHSATNFSLWEKANRPYRVNWTYDFEPYVVVKKKYCPYYDKRFSGFGWNKVAHIMELDASGFEFTVLPFGFMIHLPHAPSDELLRYRSSSKYRDCLKKLKFDFVYYLQSKYGKIYNSSDEYLLTDVNLV